MGYIVVSMKTWKDENDYQDEWSDITQDVIGKIPNIVDKIEGSRFGIGISIPSNMRIKLSDLEGQYSGVGENTKFPIRRQDSRIKIEWRPGENKNFSGWAVCGFFKTDAPFKVYEGIIDDEATETNINSSIIDIQLKGTISFLARETSLDTSAVFGDFTNWIDAILDISKVKKIISGSNDPNILVRDPNFDFGYDPLTGFDNKDGFENSTAQYIIKKISDISASAIFISNNLLYVKNRNSNPQEVSHIFRGPYSEKPTDIISISNYSLGVEKVYNFITFKKENSSEILVQDLNSIESYGSRTLSISEENITDETKQYGIINTYLDFNKDPREILNISTYFNNKTLKLKLFDKVKIDHPKSDILSFNHKEINIETDWIILSKKIRINDEIIEFELRAL